MHQRIINASRNVGVATRELGNPKPTVLLLHGYLQCGSSIFKLLDPFIPQSYQVIAPNGLFPVARGVGEHITLRYTWYFFNPATNQYLIDMEQACDYLKHIAESFKLTSAPLIIIGYSQGGYLAPFAAQHLPSTTRVIGINCRFRAENLCNPLSFRLDAIHGLADVLVDPKRARGNHQEILNCGNKGTFHGIPNEGHRFTPAIGRELAQILAPDP